MRLTRTFALGAALLVLVGACSSGGAPRPRQRRRHRRLPPPRRRRTVGGRCRRGHRAATPAIKIGSDDFYESKLVAEMWRQVLEKAGYKVERNLNIGARQAPAGARAGQIDLCPSTSGPASGTTTRRDHRRRPEEPRQLQANRQGQGRRRVSRSRPGQDTNAVGRPRGHRHQFNLAKISDLAAVQANLKWGLPPTATRTRSARARSRTYGITYPPAQRRRSKRARRRSPRPSRARRSTSPGSARPSRRSRSSGSRCSKTTRRPSRPRTSPRSSATTTSPRSRHGGLPGAARRRHRQAHDRRADQAGRRGDVNKRDVAEVAKEWLTAQGLLSAARASLAHTGPGRRPGPVEFPATRWVDPRDAAWASPRRSARLARDLLGAVGRLRRVRRLRGPASRIVRRVCATSPLTSATAPAAEVSSSVETWTMRAIASAGPSGRPTETAIVTAASSNVPM